MQSSKIIPLQQIPSPDAATMPTLCNSAQGATCGASHGPGDLPPHIWEKIKDHPCYNASAHHHFARMHVAVAPACNIQCNYCNRKYDCSNESRPGVVSERLTPEQAAKKVLAVAANVPQLSVLGIAGPGDALANPERTFKTFELATELVPDIKLCMSTNGLMLPEYVDRIAAMNIDHVTITINMIDPQIGAQIHPWIFYEGKRWQGVEASEILHRQQMKGLEMLSERGILCKVNSVMIPGINDHHLVEVNRAVKERGAFLHNIMPLISEPEHGTVFGLRGLKGPSAQELKAVQDQCEGGAKVMRHCRQCRADAVGMLNQDRSAEFTTEKIEEMEIELDPNMRREYREQVERQREIRMQVEMENLQALAAKKSDIKILVAVASEGEGRINQHFGHAKEFQIYEASTTGAKIVGHRRVDMFCEGDIDNEEILPNIVRAINDCHAVLVEKIGVRPREALTETGIEPVDRYASSYIESSVMAYFKNYLNRVASGEIVHRDRGDAAIRQGAFIGAA